MKGPSCCKYSQFVFVFKQNCATVLSMVAIPESPTCFRQGRQILRTFKHGIKYICKNKFTWAPVIFYSGQQDTSRDTTSSAVMCRAVSDHDVGDEAWMIRQSDLSHNWSGASPCGNPRDTLATEP